MLREINNCPACRNKQLDIVFTKGKYSGKLCKLCGLVFISPQSDDYRALYTDDISSSPSKYYLLSLEADRKTFSGRLDMLSGFAGRNSLLDIGCSTGNFMECALQKGWKTVYGIEPNPVSAAICSDKNLNVINGFLNDFSENPFPLKFGAIHMGDIIEHVQDPAETLCTVKKLLDENGILLIITPNYSSIAARMFQVKPLEHLLYFNECSIKNLLASGGYEILHFETQTRERSFKALKYSTTFTRRPVLKKLLNIFYIPGSGFFANLILKMLIKDELLIIAKPK